METIVHLQLSKVISQNQQLEPIYETYTAKFSVGSVWNNFLSQIRTMNFVQSKTKVVKVVSIDKKEKKEVDKEPFEKQLADAFGKKEEEKVDYEKEYKLEKQRNDDLLRRIEALEAGNQTDTEKEKRAALFVEAKSLNLSFPRNIKTDDLEKMINEAKA